MAVELAVDGPRDVLAVLLVFLERQVLVLLIEVGGQPRLRKNNGIRFMRVRVERLDTDILQLRPNGQSTVARQCPWGRCPSEDEHIAERLLEQELAGMIGSHLEHRYDTGVLHGLVGARLVQLLGTETRARCR